LVERAHHGHGAGIPAIGQGLGNLAGGFEFLVLEQRHGLLKRRCRKGVRTQREQEKKRQNIFHQAIRCISSDTIRWASAGEAHMASEGRIKSGFCGSNMSSLSSSIGSKATQGISKRSAHQPMMGSL